jgi:hypothetical protein
MAKYSKAIAALVSAVIGVLVAFNVVSPAVADTLSPETVTLLVTTVTTVAAVFYAPANA